VTTNLSDFVESTLCTVILWEVIIPTLQNVISSALLAKLSLENKISCKNNIIFVEGSDSYHENRLQKHVLIK